MALARGPRNAPMSSARTGCRSRSRVALSVGRAAHHVGRVRVRRGAAGRLLAGCSPCPRSIACGVALGVSAIGAAAAPPARAAPRSSPPAACALIAATGVLVARDVRIARRTLRRPAAWTSRDWRAVRSARAVRRASRAAGLGGVGTRSAGALRAGARIDTLFGSDAPLVRALLIADMRAIAAGHARSLRRGRPRSRALDFRAARGDHRRRRAARVRGAPRAASGARDGRRSASRRCTSRRIGAPPPALRSARDARRRHGEPVARPSGLAVGGAGARRARALVRPAHRDRHRLAAERRGLSRPSRPRVSGRGGTCRATLRGWRRSACARSRDLVLATVVTAPLVVWTFGRLSLVAPLTNLAASPVIALLQPTLFLALAPARGTPSRGSSRSRRIRCCVAFDGIAAVGAAVPFGSLQRRTVARRSTVRVRCRGDRARRRPPSSRSHGRPDVRCSCPRARRAHRGIWWIAAPAGSGFAELHLIDVGAGRRASRFARRTARWLLVRRGPQLDRRRRRADRSSCRTCGASVATLALFVLTHPARRSRRRRRDHPGRAASRRVPRCGVRRRQRAVPPVARRGRRAGRALVARASRRFARHRRRARPPSSRPIRRGLPGCATRTLRQHRRARAVRSACASCSPATRRHAEEVVAARARGARAARRRAEGGPPRQLDEQHARPSSTRCSRASRSCRSGAGNGYGHPDAASACATCGRAARRVLRTDQLGTHRGAHGRPRRVRSPQPAASGPFADGDVRRPSPPLSPFAVRRSRPFAVLAVDLPFRASHATSPRPLHLIHVRPWSSHTATSVVTIERFIIEQERLHPEATGELSGILYDLALAAKMIANKVRSAGLVDILGSAGTRERAGRDAAEARRLRQRDHREGDGPRRPPVRDGVGRGRGDHPDPRAVQARQVRAAVRPARRIVEHRRQRARSARSSP